MTIRWLLLTVFCVGLLSVGQMLFEAAAAPLLPWVIREPLSVMTLVGGAIIIADIVVTAG